MQVAWDAHPRDAWEQFHRRCSGSLQQSWAYGEALRALNVRIHRAVVHQDGQAVGLAQFMVRRIAGYVSLASCTRGPVWHPALSPHARAAEGRTVTSGLGWRLRHPPTGPATTMRFASTHGVATVRWI